MSKLVRTAQAGTMESTDILVVLAPAEAGAGIQVELVSPTMRQHGSHIKQLIAKTLQAAGIADAVVHATEKGAMDCTIEARIKTAIKRASNE